MPQLELPSEHVLPTFSLDSSIGIAYVNSSLFIQGNELECQGSMSSLESSLSVEMIALHTQFKYQTCLWICYVRYG